MAKKKVLKAICEHCDFARIIPNDIENRLYCHRFPKKDRVVKTHWCGEFWAGEGIGKQ